MKKFLQSLRKYLVVNHEHVDPHSVYIAGSYRKATVGEYIPDKTPFDKVANNYYFKRDKRRSFPKTVVYTSQHSGDNEAIKLIPSQQTVSLAKEEAKAVLGLNPPVPGKPPVMNFSNAASEYPSVNLWK